MDDGMDICPYCGKKLIETSVKMNIDKELTSIYSELKELFIYTDLIRYPYPKAMDRLSDLILEIRSSKKNES